MRILLSVRGYNWLFLGGIQLLLAFIVPLKAFLSQICQWSKVKKKKKKNSYFHYREGSDVMYISKKPHLLLFILFIFLSNGLFKTEQEAGKWQMPNFWSVTAQRRAWVGALSVSTSVFPLLLRWQKSHQPSQCPVPAASSIMRDQQRNKRSKNIVEKKWWVLSRLNWSKNMRKHDKFMLRHLKMGIRG